MQFEINPQTVITCAAVISALGVIYGFFRKMQKFIDKHEKNTQDIKEVKREQQLIFKGIFACLDGLEQLGANHTVPKVKGELEKWLNEQAHND